MTGAKLARARPGDIRTCLIYSWLLALKAPLLQLLDVHPELAREISNCWISAVADPIPPGRGGRPRLDRAWRQPGGTTRPQHRPIYRLRCVGHAHGHHKRELQPLEVAVHLSEADLS